MFVLSKTNNGRKKFKKKLKNLKIIYLVITIIKEVSKLQLGKQKVQLEHFKIIIAFSKQIGKLMLVKSFL